VRRLEDVGEDAVNQFAMAKAIASGDPRLMTKAGLESEISRFQRLRDAHYNEQHTLRGNIRHAERVVEDTERKRAIVLQDLALIGDDDQPFTMTVRGSDFTDIKDAGKLLTQVMRDIDMASASMGAEGVKQRKIASYRGCTIVYSSRFRGDVHTGILEILTTGLTYELRTKSNTPGATAIGHIIDEVRGFQSVLRRMDDQIRYYRDEQKQLTSRIGLEFALQGELDLKRAELDAINADLKRDEEAEIEAARKAALEAEHAETPDEDGDDAAPGTANPGLSAGTDADDEPEDDADDGLALSPWLRARLHQGDASADTVLRAMQDIARLKDRDDAAA
jgi:hypothetical protein